MKKGDALENFVQFVYSRLLELNNYKNVLVSTNVKIKGISGVYNEFDVYYEFRHLNLNCKVVIECKEWEKPVDVGEVRSFAEKINDIGYCQVIGVMISKNGYQSGAKKVADIKGIKLLTVDDLPSLVDIIAGIIKKGFLPDESEVGDPFWTIMEIKDGNVTGTYLFIQKDRPTIPLFFSSKLASIVLKKYIDKNRYCVRGVSQYQLRKLLDIHEIGNVQFAVFCSPILSEKSVETPYVLMEAADVEKVFYRN